MVYVTNQEDIVSFARRAYIDYPTIVNIIKPDKTKYENTPLGYATVDNKASACQEDIGQSSNVAQIAQSYSHTYPNEQIYKDCTCILAVLAQVAVDSCKRVFWVDTTKEIARISSMINIKENGYPKFWKDIQNDKRRLSGSKMFNEDKINNDLICPMNYVNDLSFAKRRSSDSTLPMDYFFKKYPLEKSKIQCRKVEELLDKYCGDVYHEIIEGDEDSLMRIYDTFDDFIADLQKVYISNKYIGLMSWLIDRAFVITPRMKANAEDGGLLSKYKSVLINTLYHINPKSLIDIFCKNLGD